MTCVSVDRTLPYKKASCFTAARESREIRKRTERDRAERDHRDAGAQGLKKGRRDGLPEVLRCCVDPTCRIRRLLARRQLHLARRRNFAHHGGPRQHLADLPGQTAAWPPRHPPPPRLAVAA